MTSAESTGFFSQSDFLNIGLQEQKYGLVQKD